MITGFEHHGRLCRRDRRPANPGSYDLRFCPSRRKRKENEPAGRKTTLKSTSRPVVFSLLSSVEKTIKPSYFERGERYLSVRVLRKGEAENECTARIPFTGGLVCLQAAQGSIKTESKA